MRCSTCARAVGAHHAAEVLYDAPDPFSRKIVIDRGATHGVAIASPVINHSGVLGQVTRVYPLSSEVTLLADKDAAIPVLNTRNQLRSAAFGVRNGMELRFMAAMPTCRSATCSAPRASMASTRRAWPVAKVTLVDRKIDTSFARILLEPVAVPDAVRHVLVLEPVGVQMPDKPDPPPTRRSSRRRREGGAPMIMQSPGGGAP